MTIVYAFIDFEGFNRWLPEIRMKRIGIFGRKYTIIIFELSQKFTIMTVFFYKVKPTLC